MNKNIISVAAIAVAVLSIALVQTASARTNDGYSRGLNDAYRDCNGLNGHGYDDSCPSGHSDSFCINYQIGYHKAWNNMGHTASARTNDGYSRGLNDAYRDYNGLNGHGYDDSCPSGHSDSFCINYQNGYQDGWYRAYGRH
jgi:hypothetical protein